MICSAISVAIRIRHFITNGTDIILQVAYIWQYITILTMLDQNLKMHSVASSSKGDFYADNSILDKN